MPADKQGRMAHSNKHLHEPPTADMLAQRRRGRWDNQRAEMRIKHVEEARRTSPSAEEQQERELMPPLPQAMGRREPTPKHLPRCSPVRTWSCSRSRSRCRQEESRPEPQQAGDKCPRRWKPTRGDKKDPLKDPQLGAGKVTRRTCDQQEKEERYRSRSVSLTRRKSESDRGRRSGKRDSSVTRPSREHQRSVIETYDTDSQMLAQDNTVWTGRQTYSDRSDESSDATMSIYQPRNHFLNEMDFLVLGTAGPVKPWKTSKPGEATFKRNREKKTSPPAPSP